MLFAFVCFLHGATWFHQVIDMNTCLLVFCSAAATSPREGKELLVQHLLVGEQDVRLLVDLEKNIITGGTNLFYLPMFLMLYVSCTQLNYAREPCGPIRRSPRFKCMSQFINS